MQNTSTKNNGRVSGFTLVEILVAISILAIVMSILYGTFSTSSATVRTVEEQADKLSSLTGAVDTVSQEVRGAYDLFSGKKNEIIFIAMTPFQEDNAPGIQTVSYEFDQGKLLRKIFQNGPDAEATRQFLLLEEVAEPSFSFFDGKKWIDEWHNAGKLPAGVKVAFSYKGKAVETVIPIWSEK